MLPAECQRRLIAAAEESASAALNRRAQASGRIQTICSLSRTVELRCASRANDDLQTTRPRAARA